MEPYEQKTPGDRGNGIMRTEAGAPSPIWLEQAAAEELAGVCMEILGNARNELYLSMRFLDVALSLSLIHILLYSQAQCGLCGDTAHKAYGSAGDGPG